MIQRENLKTVAGATLIGGIMTAGAFLGMATAQAAPHPPKPVPPDTTNNGNPGVPPKVTGSMGFVPTFAKGTYNTATCPNGTCFVPQSTSPFAIGTSPSTTNPIVANPSGTSIAIGLADF